MKRNNITNTSHNNTDVPVRARTFTGCWPCRFKKRRCSESKPVCSLCEKHGDRCSYDVRLMWLDDNLYVPFGSRMVNLVKYNNAIMKTSSNNNNNNNIHKSHRRKKLSKENFRQLMKFKDTIPSDLTNNMTQDDTFTISVRRLKIYDNAVQSVFGDYKLFDQKIIDKRLHRFLDLLDDDIQRNHKLDYRRGPFSIINCSSLKSYSFKSKPDEFESYLNSTTEDHNFKILVDASSDADQHIGSNIDNNEINNIPDREATLPLCDLNYPDMLTDLTPKSMESVPMDSIVESKIYTALWLNCKDNMILSREEYAGWFISHMKKTVSWKFAKVIEQIIDNNDSRYTQNWTSVILKVWDNIDAQTIALTLLVVLNGFNNSQQFYQTLKKWFLKQEQIRYSMYPLINFIARNSNSCEMLYHCNQLLNSNKRFDDAYQDELTFELHVLVSRNLVEKWKDRVLQQLFTSQDTTDSCSQLKYWELQFASNEQFYKDVYLMQE